MATTPDYAHLVVKFNIDPLDAGGVKEAKKVVSRTRDPKGRFTKK